MMAAATTVMTVMHATRTARLTGRSRRAESRDRS
jgi:hypothetical protein